MPPKRIVLVMIDPPLPFGSSAARWYYVLYKGLSARGHHVTAFASCAQEQDIEAARALFPGPEYDLRLYLVPERAGLRAKLRTAARPFSFMFSDAFTGDLGAVLASGFDVLHLEQLWSGWLGRYDARKAVLSLHYLPHIDMSAARPNSIKDRLYRRLEVSTERKLIRSYRHFSVCTPRLGDQVRTLKTTADVTVIPFGLDFSGYPFVPDESRPGAPVVTLIGKMDWEPTRSAAIHLLETLWPAIHERVPEARLCIVGWGAREELSRFLTAPGVTIRENVAEIRPCFEAASVLLYAPVVGSGLKIKVLEAMALGVPVVTNSEGVEGLPAVDGVHAGIVDDDDGLIERTVALLRDQALQDRQRREARRMIETVCAAETALDAVEALHGRITHGG
jgi:polysaccharide biosynthesis protein PslH